MLVNVGRDRLDGTFRINDSDVVLGKRPSADRRLRRLKLLGCIQDRVSRLTIGPGTVADYDRPASYPGFGEAEGANIPIGGRNNNSL